MTQFIKTSIPTQEYQEIKPIGERFIVHLDREDNEDGSTYCYECIVNETPDIQALTEELNEYKAYLSASALKIAKIEKCKDILKYDSSSAVNSFELRQGDQKVIDYWIDRDLRSSLEGDVKACKEISNTYKFDIRELGTTLELNCDKFLDALTLLRQYAYTAYNVTSQHLANINNLTTLTEVENYDYTLNYPSKLIFNVEDLV